MFGNAPLGRLKSINIEPTNRCNLRCGICGDTHTRARGNMDIGVYEKIVAELGRKCPDVEVRLFLSGDPLMCPDLDKFIAIGRQHGLRRFLIHTNSIMMTEDKATRLIEAGLTDISFSIDGGDKMSYEEIRGKGNFEAAVRGAQAFLKVNHGRVRTVVQVIRKYPEPLEVSAEFKALFPDAGQFMVRHPHSWSDLDSVDGSRPAEYDIPCVFLYSFFGFYWNGDAAVCCACLNGEYVLGNIKDHTVEELFNSRDMRYLRRRQEKRLPIDPKFPCAGCERYRL